jgi:hypothetical protein
MVTGYDNVQQTRSVRGNTSTQANRAIMLGSDSNISAVKLRDRLVT